MAIKVMNRSDIRYNRAVHSSTPVLRAINLSIAVLLLVGIVGAYWFVWRALPQTSGEIAAPVSARATVVRDSLGVPHIVAANWPDAVFLQGFTTAQDRMWQMDSLRRIAAGELSEVVGEATLASDQDARRRAEFFLVPFDRRGDEFAVAVALGDVAVAPGLQRIDRIEGADGDDSGFETVSEENIDSSSDQEMKE